MHSSRMRTARLLSVLGGVPTCQGGCLAGEVPAKGGGACLPGGVPACQGGKCLPGGLLAKGGVACQGGACLPGGVPACQGGVPACQGGRGEEEEEGEGVYHVTYPIMHLMLPVCCLHTN